MALSFWTWYEAERSGSRSAWERFGDAGSRERESTGRDQGETQPGGHSLAVLLPSQRPRLLLLSPSKLSPHQLHQRIQPIITWSQTLLGLFWKSRASHTFWESLSFPRVSLESGQAALTRSQILSLPLPPGCQRQAGYRHALWATRRSYIN